MVVLKNKKAIHPEQDAQGTMGKMLTVLLTTVKLSPREIGGFIIIKNKQFRKTLN